MVDAMTDRATGRLVGGLFIAATVAGVLALVLHEPAGDAHDYLIGVGSNGGRVATAALLELIMGIAVVAIAVAIYPILARSGPRMALAYVVARAAEGLLIVIGTVGSLSLLTTGRAYVEVQASDASLLALGDALLAERVWVWGAVEPIVFALSAVILNVVLSRARLVPRWLSLWGLLGGAMLDVFETKPLPAGSVLEAVPNLILTPHIAGVTEESNVRVSALTAVNVCRALEERARAP